MSDSSESGNVVIQKVRMIGGRNYSVSEGRRQGLFIRHAVIVKEVVVDVILDP